MARRKSKTQNAQPKKSQAVDPVAEASDESFPASDAPAWPSSKTKAANVKKKKSG